MLCPRATALPRTVPTTTSNRPRRSTPAAAAHFRGFSAISRSYLRSPQTKKFSIQQSSVVIRVECMSSASFGIISRFVTRQSPQFLKLNNSPRIAVRAYTSSKANTIMSGILASSPLL